MYQKLVALGRRLVTVEIYLFTFSFDSLLLVSHFTSRKEPYCCSRVLKIENKAE